MTKKSGPAGWQEITTGCVVLRSGSASEYHTGTWRSQRPVWNDQKCIKCGICYIFCPEGCVSQTEDGYFKANLDYCKGCGICAHECWPRAIAMVEEG
jgi:pyruvate ferredoxin oxidoreductase delta subunit